ncbi:pre-mRNA splicing factor CLF1 [Stagonosporopsis vannaccii]|nr:pre-mRNA splicing factor CLF1 [Stagonosporopsis vannaccii]
MKDMENGHPMPVHDLAGHCSIIFNNTLYAYSSAGFQSLELKEGAKWKKEPMDISLTGQQCVRAGEKLYIVGGSPNATAADWNYPGLMHYTFATKKWDWQRSESWNTQNRHSHGATYLAGPKKILVFSGSQKAGDLGASPETFLFSTQEPFSVQSFPSNGVPPSVQPMLIGWDTTSALMIGGGATNTAAWTFSEEKGWEDLGVSLDSGIVNQESVQCTVVLGTDGSRVLQKFDMGVSPNNVERIVLLDEGGVVAKSGTTVGDKGKRNTIADWPTYNATEAPPYTRSGFSLSQGDDGMTVALGGNAQDPLCLFDAKENAWVNATTFFGGQQVLSASETSSISSSRPTATASLTASPSASATDSTAAVAAAPDNKSKMLTVLGATLGTIFGIAAILIFILFCLKYRKNKVKKAQQTGYVEREKDRLSFADRGADFMKEAGGSVATYNLPQGNDSVTSLAIIQGRGGNGHKKNMASDASTAGLVKKPSPLAYSQEPYELSKFDLKPEPVEEKIVRQNSGRNPPANKTNGRSRSSGWSRYFANNEATNLAMPAHNDNRSTFASDRSSMLSQSQYTNSRMPSQHPSTYVPPLEIPKFDGQRLSRVASGSPTLGSIQSQSLPHQPMQAELGRANSNGSSRSGLSHNEEHYFRNPVESWTPVGDDGRPPSSTYTGSMIIEPKNNHKYDGASSYYPDDGNSFYPKSNFSSFYPGQGNSSLDVPDARGSTFTMFPSGSAQAPSAPAEEMPKSKFSSMYPVPPRLGLTPQDRESTVTVFPGPHQPQTAQIETMPSPTLHSFHPGVPKIGHESTVTMFPGGPPGGPNPPNQKEGDNMSWLNLGASR